jgi:hypothetical protein
MVMRWHFREHKSYSSYNPNMTFDKRDATRAQCYSDTSGLGRLIMLKAFDRAWLSGRKLKITWGADVDYSTNPFKVEVHDGEYDVASDTDFPSGSGWPTKGNGLLQTVFSHGGTFVETTETATLDLSGGNQTKATIFIWVSDGWSAYAMRFYVDMIQILDASDNVLLEEHFTDSVTMERTGTYGDYGYISTDQVAIVGLRAEGHDFEETKF